MTRRVTDAWLFIACTVTSLALVAFIVVIGGIVCVKDDTYTFTEYLLDIKNVYKLLLTAVLSALGYALLPVLGRINGNNKKGGT